MIFKQNHLMIGDTIYLYKMGAVEFEYRLPHKKEYGSINYFIKAVMRCPLFINSEALMFDSLIDHIKNGN